MILKGSCLCKAVRYEVDQIDMSIVHCYHETCREAHAAAFATTAAYCVSISVGLQGRTSSTLMGLRPESYGDFAPYAERKCWQSA